MAVKADALQCNSPAEHVHMLRSLAAHLWRGRLVLQAVPEAHLVGNAAQVVVSVVVAVVVVTLLAWVLAPLLTVVDHALLTVVDDALLAIVVVTQLVVLVCLGQALLQIAEVAVNCARTEGASAGF